jgi:hypothetical protein
MLARGRQHATSFSEAAASVNSPLNSRSGTPSCFRSGTNRITAVGLVAGAYEYREVFDDVNGLDLQHCRFSYCAHVYLEESVAGSFHVWCLTSPKPVPPPVHRFDEPAACPVRRLTPHLDKKADCEAGKTILAPKHTSPAFIPIASRLVAAYSQAGLRSGASY